MNPKLKTGLRLLLVILLLFLLYVAGVLVHGTATDWQPEERYAIEADQQAEKRVIRDSVLSFTIWNIGYAGLGQASDFFYENGALLAGGSMVRPPRELMRQYLGGVLTTAQSTKTDFFLFQEVDVDSKRSYYLDQFDSLRQRRPRDYAGFAANYRVSRVPLPLLEPWRVYGQVHSGIATLSNVQPQASFRHQLPGEYGWPTRIFQLDRCLSLHRYACANGKELVVMNVHLSAYDQGGSLKQQQMELVKKLCLEEYQQGNYVVVGGDWNQCPPYFQYDKFMPGGGEDYVQLNIEPEFMPNTWRWVYDPTTPTNRKVSAPFQRGKTFVTLIDFFLISPNMQVLNAKGIDQRFRYSDHQPVYMEVELDW